MDKESLGRALLGSFVRKIVTLISGILVTSGWLTNEVSDRLNTEGVVLITSGLITFVVSSWLSYKNVIWEFVKTHVARLLPPSVTMKDITQVAENVEDKSAVAKGNVKMEDIVQLTGGKVG